MQEPCTRGRRELPEKLVVPWSHPGSKTKHGRRACEEIHAENQIRSPGTSHRQDRSSKGS